MKYQQMILKSAKDLHYFYAPFIQSSVFRACIVLNAFKQTKRFDNMIISFILYLALCIKFHLISNYNIIFSTQFLSGFITNLNTAFSLTIIFAILCRMLNVMMIWIIEFFKKIVTTKKPVPKVIIPKVIIEHHLRILK